MIHQKYMWDMEGQYHSRTMNNNEMLHMQTGLFKPKLSPGPQKMQ